MSVTLLKSLFLVFAAIFLLIRFFYSNDSIKISPRFQLKAVHLARLGILYIPLLYMITPFLNFANYEPLLWGNILGILLYLFALFLFWKSHLDLGTNWSTTIQTSKQKELITNGIYTSIRHPMYGAFWLRSFAQFLLLPNWIVACSALVCFAIFYFRRIEKEEDILLQQFGKSYWLYMQKTGRIFPKSNGSK